MNIFEETTKHFEIALKNNAPKKDVIDEEDLYLTWDEFRKLHPAVSEWEWQQMQKELQEV